MAGDPSPRAVLDASALLAFLQREIGHEAVAPVIEAAVISAVNLSEVMQKSLAAGVDTQGLETDLRAVGLRVHDFDAQDAVGTAELWLATKKLGLSLGDRACLALAMRLRLPAYTADRAWASLRIAGLSIKTVR